MPAPQRFGMIARLRPDRVEEYLALHRDVWPGVEQTITACGIRNFTIFVQGDVIVGYYEYIGDDYDADQERMAADPATRAWWERTDPCQTAFRPDAEPGTRWERLDEAWHLD